MSIDLMLGFRQKPEDLGEAMASMGFALDKITPEDATYSCKMESYNFFDEDGSRRGVRFIYHDGTYKDHAEFWQEIVDDPEEIVATASVEAYMDRSAFDLKKAASPRKSRSCSTRRLRSNRFGRSSPASALTDSIRTGSAQWMQAKDLYKRIH